MIVVDIWNIGHFQNHIKDPQQTRAQGERIKAFSHGEGKQECSSQIPFYSFEQNKDTQLQI